ncbi:iron complex outermembrane receptor protein [Nonlabens dokdonensis]|uniref:Iron complex outermembrane receptor protein n=2 Tax=Nonlabens dokdonensis TaxID=328515 RepID=A0ABX5PUD8_9FLAO|nr:putative TonB-dependent receptor [Nonlabens dokdonensis DSW-6]PZX36803.1 iron complex outermembrane receptor protein [Nonlabens dokdonensis]
MKHLRRVFIAAALATTSLAMAQNTQVKDSTEAEKLEEVLVKAVRVDAKSPITHTNLSKKEIAKRNLGQDIPMLLNFLPSVVTTSDAGAGIGYTGLRIRGVSSQSTNVTINGIPYSDAESLGTFWVNLGDFASSVENLQVQRGVGTSTNGSGAFGASINILTDGFSREASGEISNSFGSFNSRKHTVKFSTGLMGADAERSRGIEIAGRLSNIESYGYVDRASTSLKSYFLQGSYVTDNTLIKAVTFGGNNVTYQSWFGIDAETLRENRTFNPAGQFTDENGNTQFYDNEVDDYRQDHYQLHWNERYNNNWSTNVGLNYTYGRGFFEQFREDDDFATYGFDELTVNGQTVNTTDLVRRRWLDNDYYVINANANYKNNEIDLIFGTSISHYDGDHFGEVIWARFASQSNIRDRYYEGNGKKNDFSVFSKATYKLNDRFQLYGDLQLRNVNYETSGINSNLTEFLVDENFTFFNPKAGVTYKYNDNNDLYFSYARANREPNRDDFESDPNVQPEQLNDFELGWRHKNGNFTFNANTYVMLYNEQLVLSGEINDVGAPIRTNSGESYRLGIELEAIIPVSSKFTIQPNLAVSSNRNVETIRSFDGGLQNLGSTDIAFSPNVVAANAFVYQPVKNLQISLLSKFVGEQFMSNTEADASKLDSYFLNDLNLIYTVKSKSIFDSVVFTGLVNNIFDQKFVSNGYYFTFDDDFSNPGTISTVEGAGFYPQAGINFLVGVTLNF